MSSTTEATDSSLSPRHRNRSYHWTASVTQVIEKPASRGAATLDIATMESACPYGRTTTPETRCYHPTGVHSRARSLGSGGLGRGGGGPGGLATPRPPPGSGPRPRHRLHHAITLRSEVLVNGATPRVGRPTGRTPTPMDCGVKSAQEAAGATMMTAAGLVPAL